MLPWPNYQKARDHIVRRNDGDGGMKRMCWCIASGVVVDDDAVAA